MNKTAIIAAILTFTLLAGHAFAQNDQVAGVDFAVSKDNVPQKEPIYSPYVGQHRSMPPGHLHLLMISEYTKIFAQRLGFSHSDRVCFCVGFVGGNRPALPLEFINNDVDLCLSQLSPLPI